MRNLVFLLLFCSPAFGQIPTLKSNGIDWSVDSSVISEVLSPTASVDIKSVPKGSSGHNPGTFTASSNNGTKASANGGDDTADGTSTVLASVDPAVETSIAFLFRCKNQIKSNNWWARSHSTGQAFAQNTVKVTGGGTYLVKHKATFTLPSVPVGANVAQFNIVLTSGPYNSLHAYWDGSNWKIVGATRQDNGTGVVSVTDTVGSGTHTYIFPQQVSSGSLFTTRADLYNLGASGWMARGLRYEDQNTGTTITIDEQVTGQGTVKFESISTIQ